MRRLSFATLVFAVASMSFLGCRQTAGPTAGGSMSSGSMSPAMQSPSFNPFGASTRVSPPPPNSSAAPNPYIGGPPGQTNAVQGTAGGFVSAAPAVGAPGMSGQVVGSGVQPAGFVGAGTNPTAQAGFATTNGTVGPASGGVAPASYTTTAPANVNPFRAGGMQVNDLTRAPSPPGYQTPAAYQAPVQGNSAPVQPVYAPASAPITPANGGAAVGGVPASNMTPIQQMPIQQIPVQQTQYQQTAIQPTQYQQPQSWQGTPTASGPDTEVASRMMPVNTTLSNTTLSNTTLSNTVPVNTLAPVIPSGSSPSQDGDTAGSSDLMWRRPGS